jgi:predicted metal-binding membrane protein
MAHAEGAGALERLLKRDRAVTAIGLVLLCLLAWLYVLAGGGMGAGAAEGGWALFPHKAVPPAPMADMPMPGMPMADMPGMASAPAHGWPGLWVIALAMWWTMMAAMMTPSAAPTVLLYARVYRHAVAGGRDEELAPAWAFVAGYLFVWLGFSIVATSLQWALERAGVISMVTMGSTSRWFSAGVLGAVGLYQLSPLQKVCLNHCRSPAEFLSQHWRPGAWGAVRLGLMHGTYCLGCCALLMTLLFVGGVMNLAWIAALALLVLAEKLLPAGLWTARASGVVFLAWAAATLVA